MRVPSVVISAAALMIFALTALGQPAAAQPAGIAPPGATSPAAASRPADAMAPYIQAIAKATDPSDLVVKYANGFAVDRADIRLHEAFVSRAIDLGMPELAYHQAEIAAVLDPRNGPVRGVLAYVSAKRGLMEDALADIAQAADLSPDDLFVQRTAGSLLAWYDRNFLNVRIPGSLKDSLGKLRGAMSSRMAFAQAYEDTKDAIQAAQQASGAQQEAPPAATAASSVTAPATPPSSAGAAPATQPAAQANQPPAPQPAGAIQLHTDVFGGNGSDNYPPAQYVPAYTAADWNAWWWATTNGPYSNVGWWGWGYWGGWNGWNRWDGYHHHDWDNDHGHHHDGDHDGQWWTGSSGAIASSGLRQTGQLPLHQLALSQLPIAQLPIAPLPISQLSVKPLAVSMPVLHGVVNYAISETGEAAASATGNRPSAVVTGTSVAGTAEKSLSTGQASHSSESSAHETHVMSESSAHESHGTSSGGAFTTGTGGGSGGGSHFSGSQSGHTGEHESSGGSGAGGAPGGGMAPGNGQWGQSGQPNGPSGQTGAGGRH